MAKYLITGRSGSGKSEVYRELKRRGRNAYDSDKVEGFASWRNPATGEPVSVDYSQPINPSETAWDWDEAILRNLLDTNDEVFVCGSADNQLEFHPLFDGVFVLTLDPKTQKQRLMSRTEHDYGKSSEMQERIVKEQAEFVQKALSLGAVVVDSKPDIETVVDTLLEHINE